MTIVALHDWVRTGPTVLIDCPRCGRTLAEPTRSVEADGHLDHRLKCDGCGGVSDVELAGWMPPAAAL